MDQNESPDSEAITQFSRELRDPGKFEEAARKLWNKYHRLLEWKIAGQLADELQGKISPESVAQAAFNSFFQRQAAGQYEIEDRRGLIELLAKIAYYKMIGRIRGQQADKRTPEQAEKKRDQKADDSDSEAERRDSSGPWQPGVTAGELEAGKQVVYPEPLKRDYRASLAVDRAVPPESEHNADELDLLLRLADPDVRAAVREAAEKMDDNLRPVFLLHIQNYNDAEIARQLGIEPGVARRRIVMMQDRWNELYEG